MRRLIERLGNRRPERWRSRQVGFVAEHVDGAPTPPRFGVGLQPLLQATRNLGACGVAIGNEGAVANRGGAGVSSHRRGRGAFARKVNFQLRGGRLGTAVRDIVGVAARPSGKLFAWWEWSIPCPADAAQTLP